MRKEAAHGKLANRESTIECAREPHAIRKRRSTRGQPANHAALHQNRGRPANCKARPPNCGRPASPSPLPTSTSSRKPAPRKRSENHQISWRIARPNAVVVVSAMYENDQTLPLPSMYDKNLAFKMGGVDATEFEEPLPSSSKGSSTRAALFRNDTRSTTFSRRTARLRRAKTAVSRSSSRSGKNANGHSRKDARRDTTKKTLVDSSKTLISSPKADALTNRRQKRKNASTNVMAQQILDLATSNARIKTMGPAKCS